MNVLQAAEQVLTEAKKPLHYQEIAKRILQRQLWTTQGKTPDQTVNARLASNIKDYGTSSRFQRTGGLIHRFGEKRSQSLKAASSLSMKQALLATY